MEVQPDFKKYKKKVSLISTLFMGKQHLLNIILFIVIQLRCKLSDIVKSVITCRKMNLIH